MKNKFSLALFIISFILFSYALGLLTGVKKLPPYGLLEEAYHAIPEIREHWENDVGLTPTRHLFAADPSREKFSIYDESKVVSGYKFIAGLFPKKEKLLGALLYDRSGNEVHYWPIDYSELDPEGPSLQNVYFHGVEVFEDGSIIVNFDDGHVLAKIDMHGKVIWKIQGFFHHVVSRSYDGTVWTWEGSRYNQFISQVDHVTGKVIRRISLIEDIIIPNGLQGQFAIRTRRSESGLNWFNDAFHPNDVEILDPRYAQAFPSFSPGDLLISLRELNLIAIIDVSSLRVKWSKIGPWYRQHDPDFLMDGSISILNNNMGFMNSQIIKIFPESGRSEVIVGGSKGLPFYIWQKGKHEHLENGNILITDSDHGRVLEVDSKGNLVWEYNNIWDNGRNGVINKAMRLPNDFFRPDVLAAMSAT